LPEIAFHLYEDMTALDAVGPYIEYDPDPPFDSGSLEKADEETQRRATELLIPEGAEATR
jgi:hypothetical protein